MTSGGDWTRAVLGPEARSGTGGGLEVADAERDRARMALVDRLVLAGLLALAAALRLASLTERGMWDSDQGRDLLVVRALVYDGVAPLLGPMTSIGGIHHGAAYYYLLAPLGALGGLDPGAILLLFAASGVAMVGLVWWLARSMGGPLAGLVAGLLVALSPPAIAASATIWNPSLLGPVAALTLAAAWRAWTDRRPRWWIVAIVAAGLAVQLHILAALPAVVVIALLVADLRRSAPRDRARLMRAALGGVAVTALLLLPLIVHELTTGFGELRAAIAFLGAERDSAAADPLTRLLIIGLRMTSWPIVGLVVDAPLAASLVACLVIGAGIWRWRAGGGLERQGAWWLVATLVWSAVGLTFAAPDLATVVRGLPNDQYHAFTDPIVPVLIGLTAAGLVRWRPRPRTQIPEPPSGRLQPGPGSALALTLLAALLIVEATRFPPLRDPDGGWPAARAAAGRVVGTAGGRPLLVVGLPDFKPADSLVFPLRLVGAHVPAAPPQAEALVVICDRLFERAIGAACGGAAEAAVERDQPRFPRLVDRFDLSGRTSVSVYLPAAGAG